MTRGFWSTLCFLAINLLPLVTVLVNKSLARLKKRPPEEQAPKAAKPGVLDASDILNLEFEYVRTTASEAMEQRHTMVNFYLLLAGFVVAGVATVLDKQAEIPPFVGTVLLWLLSAVGWIYYLSILRFRQAWHESVQAMNEIKYFYIRHAKDIPPSVLHGAFRWRKKSLPRAGKLWNVFFYSAILVAMLDSVALVAGGVLLDWHMVSASSWGSLWPLAVLGIVLFVVYLLLYRIVLGPGSSPDETDNDSQEDHPLPEKPVPPRQSGPWVEIQQETVPYTFRTLFRIVEARLRYRRFDGQMSEPMTRVYFERDDAVGVLLYDADQDAVVLVRQFRYPVYAGLSEEQRQGEGARQAWILEIVAGISEGDQSAPEVGRRELLEEAGYTVQGDLQFIATSYPSPGGSSERVHLYWGEVSAAKQAHTGGLEDEGEDTEVVVLPLQAAMDMVTSGQIQDGKTILALQHLALLKRRQRSQEQPVPGPTDAHYNLVLKAITSGRLIPFLGAGINLCDEPDRWLGKQKRPHTQIDVESLRAGYGIRTRDSLLGKEMLYH